jgi:hypothetical protein
MSGERTYPDAWKPTKEGGPGDTLEGRVVALTEGFGHDGAPCPIVTVKDADGVDHAVWLWHTTLRAELVKLRPEIGELLRLIYDGKRQSAAGHGYHVYTVEMPERPTGPSWTWDSLEAESGSEPHGPPKPPAESDDKALPFGPMAEKLAPFSRKEQSAKPDESDESVPF